MSRRSCATLLCGAALGVAACSREPSASVTVPEFARSLPGHTVAVAWRVDGAAMELALPTLPAWLPLQAATAPAQARALLGDASAVAWPSLAESKLFQRTAIDAPVGAVRVFVDLQQLVDLLPRALAADTGRGMPGLTRVLASRLSEALRLRGFSTLSGAVDPASAAEGQHRFDLTVRSGESEAGLLAAIGPPPAQPANATVPAGAEWSAIGACASGAVVAMLRDVLAGDGDDTAQMLQQLLRGPRLQAGLAAAAACAGDFVVVGGGSGWLWAKLGVRDRRALADALDAAARPDGDGWMLGDTKLRLRDAGLLIELGRVPAGSASLTGEPGATLTVRSAALGLAMTLAPVERGAVRARGSAAAR